MSKKVDDKSKSLEAGTVPSDEGTQTSNQGTPIADNQNTLRGGPRGPALMEDFLFREKMTHFDHERIPERVVHPRGSGAHGYFQVYEPLTELTKAKFLQDPSKKTPVFVRFSTVVGFRGSADTVRDVRGFATKFYTEDGNFDLVGNNMPIFFIQDAIKFPDLVHAIKPEPHNEMPQASAAHDNFWDFISLMPESIHMILWVLSDRALPRSYRMMEGFGVHTFRMINEAGVSRLVKFHWKPMLGVHALTWDETQKLAGKDPDFNRRDLWENIEMGNAAEFELGVQVVEEKDADRFDFDLLDATKMIPEELVPVRRIGKMTLDRNPDNFFAETEQVAFHPGHIVPGIDFTNDPLLQGRLFSYLDTQLIRLGGPNFAELPINRPLAEVRNNQRDGFMRQTIHKGPVNYEPNSLGGGCPMASAARGFHSFPEAINAQKVRARPERFSDHFTQATLFWNSQSAAEKRHIISAGQFELGKVEHMHIRQRVVDLLAQVDRALADGIAAGVGVTVTGDLSYLDQASTAPKPGPKRGAAAPGVAPSLSMIQTVKGSIKSRKVAALIADGFDAVQLEAARKRLEKEGAKVVLVSKKLGPCTSQSGPSVEVDKSFSAAASVMFDAVFVPGGAASVTALSKTGEALHFVEEAYKHCKPIGAFAEGVDLLAAGRLPATQRLAAPDTVENHEGTVTALGKADQNAFLDELVAAIAQHRHWDREPMTDGVPA